jgi:uncharacterized protein (DUF305 family)
VIRTAVASLAAAIALAGCSPANKRSASSARSSSSTVHVKHNANDDAYVRLEIAHHGQAVEMAAAIALRRAQNARVRSLAGQIKDRQIGGT